MICCGYSLVITNLASLLEPQFDINHGDADGDALHCQRRHTVRWVKSSYLLCWKKRCWQVLLALLILMLSQFAAICHVIFSSAVMGPLGPPNTGREHDVSAWLFSWLNLLEESTTQMESLCRCSVFHLSELIRARPVNKDSPPIACCLSHLMTHTRGLSNSVENGCHT